MCSTIKMNEWVAPGWAYWLLEFSLTRTSAGLIGVLFSSWKLF